MGGQACIVYGAAEFSRDADLAVVADADNLARRTPALLVAVAREWPAEAASALADRAAVKAACRSDEHGVEAALAAEQEADRGLDRAYWAPLRAELERLRREQRP